MFCILLWSFKSSLTFIYSNDDISIIDQNTKNDIEGYLRKKGYASKSPKELKLDLKMDKSESVYSYAVDEKMKLFYSTLINNITDCRPLLPEEGINNDNHYLGDKLQENSSPIRQNLKIDPIRTKTFLSSLLQLSKHEKEQLTISHQCITKSIPNSYPEDIKWMDSGYVYIGGGKYDWLVLISIIQLRSTGAKLPIEVIIPTQEEYNDQYCEVIYPKYNAKCLKLTDTIDTSVLKKTNGFQYKALALLISSFANVLMLDSDNFPMKNPDYLFQNAPFTNHGMVIWPDFWRRSISPDYYDIASIQVNENEHVRNSFDDDRDLDQENISFHDLKGAIPEASSESGQLLINKISHASAIFLALYYNMFGPDYYYGLFSQGQAGMGDKDTFIAAAHQQGLPYYQVKEYVKEFGCAQTNEEQMKIFDMDISAMGQYDAIVDYFQSKSKEYDVDKEIEYEGVSSWDKHRYYNSELMFLHTNQPKLFPWNLQHKGDKTIFDHDGLRRRLYSKRIIKEAGFDFERRIWEIFEELVCERKYQIPQLEETDCCKEVLKQKEFLKWDEEFGNLRDSKVWPDENVVSENLQSMYPSYEI